MTNGMRGPMPSKRVWLAIMASAGLVITSCGGGTDEDSAGSDDPPTSEDSSTTTAAEVETSTSEADSTPEADSTTTVAEAPESDVSEPPVITLIDPGTEPLVELRFDLTDGDTSVLSASQVQEFSQQVDGADQPSPGPLAFDTEIEAVVAAEGDDYRITSTVTSFAPGSDVLPSVAETLESELQSMVGLTTESLLDSRGVTSDVEVSGLPDSQAGLIGDLISPTQSTVLLPEEAVGVGATWEVSETLSQLGAEVEQTSVYEVVAIDGPIVTLAVTGTQDVDPETTINLSGVEATVIDWEVTSTGDIELDLGSFGIVGTLETTGSQEMEVSSPDGTAIALVQTLSSSLEFDKS